MEAYVFAPAYGVVNDASITLNGGPPLAVAPNGTLPDMEPVQADPTAPLQLPPYGMAMALFPSAVATACG